MVEYAEETFFVRFAHSYTFTCETTECRVDWRKTMGYLCVAIALAAGLTKGFCGKKTSALMKELPDAMLMNVLRMLFCVAIGFFFVLFSREGVSSLQIPLSALLVCLLNGIAQSAFVVIWLITVRRGSYMLIDVFLTMGVLVPLLLCKAVFGDAVYWYHWVGFAILVVATLIMCSYNNQIKKKLDFTSVVLLILCGLSDNLCSFAQKWRSHSFENVLSNSAFNFYSFIVSAVFLSVCFLICRKYFAGPLPDAEEEENYSPIRVLKTVFPFVAVMSVALFVNSFFSAQAAVLLSPAEQYPLTRGCSLILSLLMSHFCFKERIRPKCVAGIALTMVALFIMNVLPELRGM
ncbi:MAG: hypothetical protein MJ078_04570 [Clostridia bacterium]|nr:hypothetical protein [Clostridia bacterium]